jgi:hypothetical protein
MRILLIFLLSICTLAECQSGSVLPDQPFSSQQSGMLNVLSFHGQTADLQINACLASIPAGGVCDARAYGASRQVIAATVYVGNGQSPNGYTAPNQVLLFSPATVFVPAAPNVQMFQLGIGARIDGLNIYTGDVPVYRKPAVLFSSRSPSWFYLGAVLTNSRVFGTLAVSKSPPPTQGSACLALESAIDSQAVAFSNVQNFSCVGEYDGILMSASGNGYVNSNSFSNVTIYGSVNNIEMTTSGSSGAGIQGNSFSNLQMEWGNLGIETQYNIYQHGSVPNSISNNSFHGLSLWDTPSDRNSIYLADSSSKSNWYDGYLVSNHHNGQVVDKSGNSNSFVDTNWSDWNYVGIGTLLQTSQTNGNLVPDSGLLFGWTYWGGEAPSPQWAIVPAGDPYSLNALRMSYSPTENNTPIRSQVFTVKPATTYTFSYNFDSEGLNRESEPNIDVIDAATSAQVYGSDYPPINVTAAACLAEQPATCRRNFTVKIPAGAKSVAVLVNPYRTTFEPSGFLDFGGFMLQQGLVASAYLPGLLDNTTGALMPGNLPGNQAYEIVATRISLMDGKASYTFSHHYSAPPVCTVGPTILGNNYKVNASPSSVTVTSSSTLDASTVAVICSPVTN